MLTVETIARVRREQARGKSVRAIARDLRLSRDTVTKYLRSGETEAKYERHCQPYPQLGPFLADLEELLERNGRQPPRDRLDKRQLFEALRRAGYAGGYDAVRRYARRWADIRATKTEAKATEAFIPLSFAPAEAYQFNLHGGPLVKSFCCGRAWSGQFDMSPIAVGGQDGEREMGVKDAQHQKRSPQLAVRRSWISNSVMSGCRRIRPNR